MNRWLAEGETVACEQLGKRRKRRGFVNPSPFFPLSTYELATVALRPTNPIQESRKKKVFSFSGEMRDA